MDRLEPHHIFDMDRPLLTTIQKNIDQSDSSSYDELTESDVVYDESADEASRVTDETSRATDSYSEGKPSLPPTPIPAYHKSVNDMLQETVDDYPWVRTHKVNNCCGDIETELKMRKMFENLEIKLDFRQVNNTSCSTTIYAWIGWFSMLGGCVIVGFIAGVSNP